MFKNTRERSPKIHGNPQESLLGIRGNSQESFTGKSCENVYSYSKEFLVTHSEEILMTLSNEFLVTNSREFLVTNSAEKPEKMWTKFVEIFENFPRKVLQNPFLGISWELFPRFSQEYLKIFSAYS